MQRPHDFDRRLQYAILFENVMYVAPSSAHDFERLDAGIRHRIGQGTLTYAEWQDAEPRLWSKLW